MFSWHAVLYWHKATTARRPSAYKKAGKVYIGVPLAAFSST